MKNIILDCDLMKFPHSGIHRYCLHLGQALLSLSRQDQGTNISFYVPPSAMGAFGPGVRHISDKKKVSNLWNHFRPFLWSCDVWHATFQTGRMVPHKKLHRYIKVVLTVHDLNVLHEGQPVSVQSGQLKHAQRLIDRADAIVCISDFVKNDVLQHCRTGNKPVHVILNGRNELASPALGEHAYKPLRPFLFGLGYVNRKKNYDTLLPLIQANEHLELVIAGYHEDTEYVNEIRMKAEQLGVSGRLILTGPVSEPEKSWYFNNCTAFVHPSLAEGFGLPVIEAMSVGCPLFISDKTALPEIAGDAAYYFSSFEPDHMLAVFRDGMRNFEQEGKESKLRMRSEQFSWEASAARYLEVYKSLMT